MNLTRDQLEEIIGAGALRDYDDARGDEQPNLNSWAAGLRDMSDGVLVDEAASAAYAAAFANNRGWWWDGSWCMASACSYEANRRHMAAGHSKDCQGDTLYSKGFRRAMQDAGHEPPSPVSCTCKADEDRAPMEVA